MKFVFFLVSILTPWLVECQLTINSNFQVTKCKSQEKEFNIDQPLLSFELNKDLLLSSTLNPKIKIEYRDTLSTAIQSLLITLRNISADTITIRNVVPLGVNANEPYITGLGDHWLSRAHLFIPNTSPVNIIVPDNSWNMGWRVQPLSKDKGIYALARRIRNENSQRSRFEAKLYPKGSVTYQIFIDEYTGDWRNALRKCFQEKMLYDLPAFDDSMYKRNDLAWIKEAKMIHLLMAWDQRMYDRKKKKYDLKEFIQQGKKLYGGDDIIALWPTWPALGIDPRNQWDMYRDMPGGLPAIKNLSDECHKQGVKFFLSYNPWDESTRKEDHLKGMADLIQQTNADGVVLDTRGASSKELQAAADAVKPGIIMYSEGMAVPLDMESIISGRVHNALYYPPILNLNKLIRPDFGIYRVAEIYKEPIRREIFSSLFNGYGIEFNVFHPGNRADEEETYKFLGNALRILRENNTAFNGFDWQPLNPSLVDKIWINYWPGMQKDIYTIYSSIPEGNQSQLVKPIKKYDHYVDILNHREIKSADTLTVRIDAFDSKYLGTNNEGNMAVIAGFKNHLQPELEGDQVNIKFDAGDKVKIWPGRPSYTNEGVPIFKSDTTIDLTEAFPDYEGEYIIQLFDKNELIDERIIDLEAGTPRLISNIKKVTKGSIANMVLIPSDTFTFYSKHGDEFIPYTNHFEGKKYNMPSYFMDKYPVTNKEYYTFLIKSNYKPSDKTNFLKHWTNGKPPLSIENHPVVYISYEDALAYAKWMGKRLPTEVEWQYAAQSSKRLPWPWGADSTDRTSEVVNETLTHYVISGIDSTKTNIGNGHTDPVGSKPLGVNPFGLYDLTGNVWQMTNDLYKSGKYYYTILKGGSHYKPTDSWWYVQGGPQELSWRQMLLRVNQGFERKSTVGFRCVRD